MLVSMGIMWLGSIRIKNIQAKESLDNTMKHSNKIFFGPVEFLDLFLSFALRLLHVKYYEKVEHEAYIEAP